VKVKVISCRIVALCSEVCWTAYQNTGISGGACVRAASTVDDCKRECVRNASCVGIDWMSHDQVCLIHGHWSDAASRRVVTTVTHYDYHCRQKDQQDSSKCQRVLVEGKKGKVFAYSLPSVGPGADPGVRAVSPQVT